MNTHYISAETLTFARVNEIVTKGYKLALSDDAKNRIQKCRDYLDKKMETQTTPIYGITTGFGSLCNHNISKEMINFLSHIIFAYLLIYSVYFLTFVIKSFQVKKDLKIQENKLILNAQKTCKSRVNARATLALDKPVLFCSISVKGI